MKKYAPLLLLSFYFFDTNAALTDISPIGKVNVSGNATQKTTAAPKKRSGKEIYTTTCSVCHGTGVAGAPIVGNNTDWAPRIAQGMNTLLKSAINGKGGMPPKGGVMTLSNAEIKSVIVYMTNQSK